jgi:hypothetical protein
MFDRKSTEKRLLERTSLRWGYNINIGLNGRDVRVYVELMGIKTGIGG